MMTNTKEAAVLVYGEPVTITAKNRTTLRSIQSEYGIPMEILEEVWGYISQAIMDCRDASDRAFKPVLRRVSAKTIFEGYAYLLNDYQNRLEDVAEILPEIGCRAATPEGLFKELRDTLRWPIMRSVQCMGRIFWWRTNKLT